jgi:hypothetical protein
MRPPSRVDTKNVPMIEETMDAEPSASGNTSAGTLHEQATEQHGRDDGHGIGLEQVGSHAGTVADVVADVVGDHRRIARVIFRDARLDLAHQVSADVGTLGENTAAESRENRNQRAAEGQSDQ